MKYVLEHKGKPYNKFFEEISCIPRVTYNEKAISDYLVKFAQDRGLWWYRDEIWNVIIKKPASLGYEKHPAVMIQGHTDMVGEKTPDSDFNFDTDPLDLYVENGFLKARNTTLGADCGHGVAYMLSILDDDTLKHPPLEAFFSVQEESGIGGPRFVDYSKFTAKILISTDMMSEGTTYVSTANVVGGYFTKNINLIQNHANTYELKVAGLYGGHAAMNAYRDQANAIKIAARILFNVLKIYNVNIADIKGGTIKNNIPEECFVAFSCDCPNLHGIKEIITATVNGVRDEYAETDPQLYVEFRNCQKVDSVADDFSSKSIIELIQLLSTGSFSRSLSIKDFVIGSRNLGTAELDGSILKLGYIFRSAKETQIEDFINRELLVANFLDAKFEEEYRYYGYNTDINTPLIRLFAQVYKEESGKELEYMYIHGGTDAGTIIKGMGGMDTIGIGPNTYNYHRPGESLDLESFDRTYSYLTKILERL